MNRLTDIVMPVAIAGRGVACRRWFNLGLVIVCIVVFRHSDALPRFRSVRATEEGSWTSMPGNITALAHTNVTFDWVHSIENHVHIVWDYKYGPKGRIKPLMEYISSTLNLTRYIENVHYLEFQLSASMLMENVALGDSGIYKVKVIELERKSVGGSNYFIEDMVQLDVISASDVKLTVAFDGMIDEISVDGHGPAIELFEVEHMSAQVVKVKVDVHRSAPFPVSISVCTELDDTTMNEYKCERSRTCVRDVPIGSDVARSSNATLVTIIVRFDVQNLESVRITKTYYLSGIKDDRVGLERSSTANSDSTSAAKLGFGIGLGLGIPIVLSVFLVIFVGIPRWRRHQIEREDERLLGNEMDNRPGRRKLATDLTIQTLNVHRVAAEDLPTSEYMFQFDCNFREHDENDSSGMASDCEVVATMTALMNTSGGIIILENQEPTPITDKKFKSWTNSLKNLVTKKLQIMSYQTYKNCVNTTRSKSGHSKVHIFVAKAPKPILYSWLTYERDASGAVELNKPEKILQLLVAATSDDLDMATDTVDVTDTQRVASRTSGSEDFIVNLVSLGNTPGGGYVIREDVTESTSEDNIRCEIEQLIQSCCSQGTFSWGTQGIPEHGKHWTLSQKRQEGNTASNNASLVWVMQVEECVGGAFLERPKCFIVNDAGTIVELSVEGCRSYASDPSSILPNPYGRKTAQPGDDTETDTATNATDIRQITWKPTVFTPVKNRLLPANPSLTIPADFKFKMFSVDHGWKCTPNQATIEQIFNDNNIEVAGFKELLKNKHGWIVALPNILGILNSDPEQVVPTNHLVDLLVAPEKEPLRFIPVVSGGKQNQLRQYCVPMARLLKKQLVQQMMKDNSSDVPNMHIIPSYFDEDKCEVFEEPDFQEGIGRFYNRRQHRENSEELILPRALAALLMSSDMYVKNLLAEDLMLNSTTGEQENVLKSLMNNSHVYLGGPPGTGKSWITQQACNIISEKNSFEKTNNVYIHVRPDGKDCTHDRLRETCNVHEADSMSRLSKITTRKEWNFVILDVDQSFTYGTTDDWKTFLDGLHTKRLIICQDTVLDPSGKRAPSKLNEAADAYCASHNITLETSILHKTYRTSGNIASFMKSSWPEVKRRSEIIEAHRFDGDDVVMHVLPWDGTPDVLAMADYITKHIDNLTTTASLARRFIYEPGEIAVAVDTEMATGYRESLLSEVRNRLGQHPPDLPGVQFRRPGRDSLETKALVFVMIGDGQQGRTGQLEDKIHITDMASKAVRRVDLVYQGPEADQLCQRLGFADEG